MAAAKERIVSFGDEKYRSWRVPASVLLLLMIN